jgi:hypothetical protein
VDSLCNGDVLRKGEGKAVPVQTEIGSEGSRGLRIPGFLTVCS